MSTLEATVSLLKNLPENDLIKIKAYIGRIINNKNDQKDSYNPFITLSREEVFEQLESSRKRTEKGFVMAAKQASAIVRDKYGL